MGASGLVMTLQALGTSTSKMAFLFSLFVIDRVPSVAASLGNGYQLQPILLGSVI